MNVVAENLTITRGGRRILSDVSFSLSSGDCLILRGRNGIGKTTLLRVLAGLGTAEDGTLRIDQDQIGYTGHLDALKSALTVQENLDFWASLYQHTKLAEVIEQLNLASLLHRRASRLSAGQKRRLGLSRLLLSNASIWLMDEPTNSLDTQMTGVILDAVAAHTKKGGIAILSTHLELDLPNVTELNLEQFLPVAQTETSPFLAQGI